MRQGGIALDTLGWLLLATLILIILIITLLNAQPLAEKALDTIKTILTFI